MARASALLRTRVDIAREQQNQLILAATNRRSRLQLKLQQAVEGLSVESPRQADDAEEARRAAAVTSALISGTIEMSGSSYCRSIESWNFCWM